MGDVVYRTWFGTNPEQQGLFFRSREGKITRIIAHGDPAPDGELFTLLPYSVPNVPYPIAVSLAPQVNDRGTLAFLAPVNPISQNMNSRKWGIFSWQEGYLWQVALEGQPVADLPGQIYRYPTNGSFKLNSTGLISFIPPRGDSDPWAGDLYLWPGGEPVKIASTGGQIPVPGGGQFQSHYFGPNFLSLNDSGSLAFNLWLYGLDGRFANGLFLSSLERALIPNGGFELVGTSGLPVAWETSWSETATLIF